MKRFVNVARIAACLSLFAGRPARVHIIATEKEANEAQTLPDFSLFSPPSEPQK